MSLKGVELQIAIPKTIDAGKMADHANQLTLRNQEAASDAMMRQLERNRSTVTTTLHAEELHEEKDPKHQDTDQQNEQEDNIKEAKVLSKHPYKGNFVDFSG
jgi:hypothetical protein